MSKQPDVQYHDPSGALASSVRDVIQSTKEAAEKHLRENRDNAVLPIKPTKVAQDMQLLLHERDASFRNYTYRPVVLILPRSLPVPAQVRYACGVVLYREGEIDTELVTKEGSRKIEWKDNGTVIVLPGDSAIKSTGDGTLVVYFQNYLIASSE